MIIDGVEYVKKSEAERIERNFVLLDSANVLAMGKIQNFEDENKPLHLLMDFARDNKNIQAKSLLNRDTFEIWKENKLWGKYSIEYYEKALRIASIWRTNKLDFYVQEKKNSPLLMSCDEFGFVLAPRIEDGEEI